MATKIEKTQKVYSAILSIRGDFGQQVAGEWTGAELLILRDLHGKGGAVVCLTDVKEVGTRPFLGHQAEYDALERRYTKPVMIRVFGHRPQAVIPLAFADPGAEEATEAAETAEA